MTIAINRRVVRAVNSHATAATAQSLARAAGKSAFAYVNAPLATRPAKASGVLVPSIRWRRASVFGRLFRGSEVILRIERV